MSNDYFQFKQFIIHQGRSAFKVGTDGVILGAEASVSGVRKILDVGAGTGLISIMLAQRSDAEIDSIEPDEESYNELVENVRQCKWSSGIRCLNTDLQNHSPGYRYDLIVSNPPYFRDSLINPDTRKSRSRHTYSLPPEVLLRGVGRLLEDDGRFEVIMPYAEGNVFIAEAVEFNLFCYKIMKIKPLPSSEIRRMVLGFSRKKQKPVEKFLTIEHGKRHDFTEEYRNLTKDFYLKF
jgi:tRNA1Val (adenine37-N6)-methyltransferase